MENYNLTLTTLRPEMRDAMIDYAAEFQACSVAGSPPFSRMVRTMSV